MRDLRALLVVWPLAQLPHVPPVSQLPRLPIDLGRTVSGAVDPLADRLADSPLAELRQLRVRELLRTQHKLIEADPQGAPIRRSEVLAFTPSPEALQRAKDAGFTVARERVLEGMGATVIVLGAPPRLATRRALGLLRQLDPGGTYDFNHLYFEGGTVGQADSASADTPPPAPASQGTVPIRIGLVDGGVDASHPVFEGLVIQRHGCGEKPVPSPHGTAVASLIAGHAGRFHGAVPGAELFAADIYCGRPTGGAMDDIAEAIAWVVAQRVPVINVSLVGPRNALLEIVVRTASAKGHLIVAAVGNDGPAARPLYPAAYPDVVGVTAVDVRRHVLLEACRGPHVDFAAPGADMSAAVGGAAYAPVRGTSFAAPLVASLLAEKMSEPNREAAQKAVASFAGSAVDLGDKGVDVIYGNGLVGEALRTDPSLASAGK